MKPPQPQMGAELAIASGATYPSIKAVIALSLTSVVSIGFCPCGNGEEHRPRSSWSYQGKPLPFVMWTKEHCLEALKNIRQMERFDHVHRAVLNDVHAVEEATIPVEKINGPILHLQTTLLRMNGGTAPTNAYASEDSYSKVLAFLRDSFH